MERDHALRSNFFLVLIFFEIEDFYILRLPKSQAIDIKRLAKEPSPWPEMEIFFPPFYAFVGVTLSARQYIIPDPSESGINVCGCWCNRRVSRHSKFEHHNGKIIDSTYTSNYTPHCSAVRGE